MTRIGQFPLHIDDIAGKSTDPGPDLKAKANALSPAKRALLEHRLRQRAASSREKPIQRRHQTVAPLSFSQELLWLVDQLAPDKVNYTVPRIMRLKGHLNIEALEGALTTIVDRHEVLRTSIVGGDGAPVQRVRPSAALAIDIIDLQKEPEASRFEHALAIIRTLLQRPFDLTRDDLLRPTVVCLAPDDQILLVESHHIASDGWSKGVMFDELEALYAANCHGLPHALPELPIQYSDYALWQREVLTDAVLKEERSYWRQQLAGAPALLEFPTAKRRPAAQSFEGKWQRVQFSKEILDAAQQFSMRESVTLFMTLLAAFDAFISRYTGQTDLVIGTPIAGRNRPEQEHLIGYFTNTLALRTDLSGDPTFREIVKRVRQTSLSAYEHQDLPFELLVKELRPDRTLSYSAVFQVMFSVGHGVQTVPRLQGLEATQLFVERGTSRFDLLFGATALPEGLALTCEYNTDIFEDDTIRQMIGCFETLLVAAVAEPDTHLSGLPLLKPHEIRQQVEEWNQTTCTYPEACLHTLFEEQVSRTPYATAVEDAGETLTYEQLDVRANKIAQWLLERGAGIETPVGVCLERSATFAAVLLGVLKAGCSCVLIDPSLPSGRVQQIADDADVLVLLTGRRVKAALGPGDRIVCLEDEMPAIERQTGVRPHVPLTPDHLAYILYTSGSTGLPKGVLLEHRGMVNHHAAVAREFGLTPADRVLQFSSLGFDICLEEMFPTWITGGTVVFRSEAMAGTEFLAWLERHRITVMDVPTAFWHAWVHDLKWMNARPPGSLRLLIVGGERASRAVHSVWRQFASGVRWLNTYGPTEASIIATVYEPPSTDAGQESEIPIGRPIANAQAYILDSRQRPVPIGVPGELYLGGVGVARGYLNRPEQTAERFVRNPFVPSGRLYRTGDVARYRADGNIEFVGRTDDQIKIRGFRVEPAEVSSVLAREPGVQQAVVVGVSRPEPQLVAYVVPVAGAQVDGEQLRNRLKLVFPSYMVPSAFVLLESLPITAHGKVDYARLPPPSISLAVADTPQEPRTRTPLEEMLVTIWERVLNRRPIGVRDDFFEVGGHSLLAVQLLSQVSRVIGVDLPLATLFMARTVEALAHRIEAGAEHQRLPTVIPIQPEGSGPALFCVVRPNVNALGYVFLARKLGHKQPVYGLQNTIDASKVLFTQSEYEQMAAEYIAAMREVQPNGPYLLIGLCEGAHIAFEMARQLHQNGDEIGLVVILDAWAEEHTRRRYLVRFHYQLLELRRLIRADNRVTLMSRKIRNVVRELGRAALGRFRPDADQDLRNTIDARFWPDPRHIPTYLGSVLLFRVHKQPYWRVRDPLMGWGRRALGGVEAITIRGEHPMILREPMVGTVAEVVGSRIASLAQVGKRVTSRDSDASEPVLISEWFPPAVGGSAELLANVYSRISDRTIAVITDAAGPIASEAGGASSFRVVRAPFGSNDGYLRPDSIRTHLRLVARLRKATPLGGVVHCGRALPEGWVALLSRRMGGRPYVCWTHGEELAYAASSREHSWMLKRVHRGASALIANSQHTANLLLALGNPPERVHVVHPGVDAERFRPSERGRGFRSALVRNDELMLLSVGRLMPRKGHALVIRALARIGRQVPALRYVIVGDGAERQRLRALAAEVGVEDCVQFLGEVPADDLPAYYAAADIFVHPNRVEGTEFEGFGLVFLEAAAAEVPSIGGRSGGVPEAVQDGVTGLLVSGEDVGELAAAVRRLAESAALRAQFGRAGRARVLKYFSWERAAAQVAAIDAQLRKKQGSVLAGPVRQSTV
jgi:amino acid adenylation domain-containing protein